MVSALPGEIHLHRGGGWGGCACKAVPGRDNTASFSNAGSLGYFSSGRSGVQGVPQTGNKCKNVLYRVCVGMGSLVEHWVSDWLITCYCLIAIRIIKVII